jgi:hypothetical protein
MLLGHILAECRQTGGIYLGAVEIAFRAALHQAGAAALTRLLQFTEPAGSERPIPCSCGHQSSCRELRSRHVLTALGHLELTRPWYPCPHCHQGQFPADEQLDVKNTDFSPGVRRMQAVVNASPPSIMAASRSEFWRSNSCDFGR